MEGEKKMFYRKYEEPFENGGILDEDMQMDNRKILIGVVAFVLVLLTLIAGLFWLNSDNDGDYGNKLSQMSAYAQENEFDRPYKAIPGSTDFDKEQKPMNVTKNESYNYYNSYDDYNYDYSDYYDNNYDYSCEDYNYDYSSKTENNYGETRYPVEGLEDIPELHFSSGAGGWGTSLTIDADGTFVGKYTDSNMGEAGPGYPNGTCYISTFGGRFTDVEKVDEYTYSMRLESVETEESAGEEWIEDGILFIAAEPYGLEDGEEFILYLPGTSVNILADEFLSWAEMLCLVDEWGETMSTYGLYNVDMGYGFMEHMVWE